MYSSEGTTESSRMQKTSLTAFRKVFVSVRLLIRPDGTVRPLSLIWEDGRSYRVDRVLHVTPAASLRVGGRGMRYTVMIGSRERYLFDEDGRWFVEAPTSGG